MGAYATRRLSLAVDQPAQGGLKQATASDFAAHSSVLDALIDQFAERVVERLAAVTGGSLATGSHDQEEWFDSRHAADYLGIHRDTLRKLSAERGIPSQQDGPNCKLYFRRADLDAWRLAGGRPRHLATTLASAA